MSRIPVRIVLLSLLLFSLHGHSQINDAGLWLSVNIEKKITPLFSVDFSQEMRMNENISEVGTLFSDLGLQYKAGKHLKFAAMYRYSKKRRLDDTYETRWSQYMDISYKQDFDPLAINLRMRYQLKNAELFTSSEATSTANLLIPKLTLKYDLGRKYEPYLFAEPYCQMGTSFELTTEQLRFCAGIEYAFNRMHAVDLHYIFQKKYTLKQPYSDYVIGLDYIFTF
jgi:hypothetical protein